LNLPLLDHLILGNGDWSSLRQTTTLWAAYPDGV
jgi:DNA repair protein RadC